MINKDTKKGLYNSIKPFRKIKLQITEFTLNAHIIISFYQ
jgi:hypothetical protein